MISHENKTYYEFITNYQWLRYIFVSQPLQLKGEKHSRRIVYFATFPDNAKVSEIAVNPLVAFTTIPEKGNAHIKARGQAVKSMQTIWDLADVFCAKIPDYAETIEQVGQVLIVYEIHVDQAVVTIDIEHTETLIWQ